MRELTVRTRQTFACSASTVWSLMCNSRMDDTTTLLFKLGVPQPVQCRVVDGKGGVGGERECISDQGVVHQRILVWMPEKCLAFRMESTDMNFRKYVRDIADTFELVATTAGVVVTRTTRVSTQGRSQFFRRLPLFVSLKQVHRYVFRNWERLARKGTTTPSVLESGSASAPTV